MGLINSGKGLGSKSFRAPLRSNPVNVIAVGIDPGTKVVTTRIALAIAGMKVAPSLAPSVASSEAMAGDQS